MQNVILYKKKSGSIAQRDDTAAVIVLVIAFLQKNQSSLRLTRLKATTVRPS